MLTAFPQYNVSSESLETLIHILYVLTLSERRGNHDYNQAPSHLSLAVISTWKRDRQLKKPIFQQLKFIENGQRRGCYRGLIMAKKIKHDSSLFANTGEHRFRNLW